MLHSQLMHITLMWLCVCLAAAVHVCVGDKEGGKQIQQQKLQASHKKKFEMLCQDLTLHRRAILESLLYFSKHGGLLNIFLVSKQLMTR